MESGEVIIGSWKLEVFAEQLRYMVARGHLIPRKPGTSTCPCRQYGVQ